jgi:branched-chain amino acid transport system ATP-binding protein
MTTLQVSNLRVRYGAVEVVHGLSFDLEAGDSLVLLGPNGSGKTSSVEAIAGLLPKAGGSVLLDGRDITAFPANEVVKNGVALVPQWRELFPSFSVEESLLAAVPGSGNREAKSLDYIYELFPKLLERRRQLAGSLSGGEQQMLAIGRALISSPRILVLDEPSAGLAAGVINALVSTIDVIRREGVSILLVEQRVEIAEAISDRCIVMSAGTVKWEGSMADMASRETIHRAYFH